MVAEYLRAKARKWSLSLESLAKRYNVKQKEVDLIAPYLKDRKTFYDIPADIVEEYGKADVIATEQVALKQLEAFGLTFEDLYERDIKLSFEMTDTLSRIESNGLKINLDTLAQIEKEYEEEMHTLEIKLRELAKKAMGDTPINLASPDDKSMLLYSRKVKDKTLWSMTFNLGHEMRGNTIKPKMRTRMKNTDFVRHVRQMTDIVYKTIGRQCETVLWIWSCYYT